MPRLYSNHIQFTRPKKKKKKMYLFIPSQAMLFLIKNMKELTKVLSLTQFTSNEPVFRKWIFRPKQSSTGYRISRKTQGGEVSNRNEKSLQAK